MGVAIGGPIFDSVEDWQVDVAFYAEDLRLLADVGLSQQARQRVARLADAHGLLPTQLVALLLNAYFERPETEQQVAATEAVGLAVRRLRGA